MKRFRYLLLTLALAALLIAITIRLFHADFSSGQTYPEYSSLRADPKGAKLLYDSLAREPGFTVSRNFFPVNTLKLVGTTLVLISCNLTDPGIDVIEAAADSGNRILLALPDEFETTAPERWSLRRWGLRFKNVPSKAFGGDPTSRLSEAIGWTVIDKEADKDGAALIAVEKTFGKGSIALFAASDDFANRSTYDDASADLSPIARALGSNQRIVFDESHLGVAESGSVVALAARFRLAGVAIGFAILAALFIWRNTSSFPPARERASSGPARSASQGLETLLRRHVPAVNLAAGCWREWIASNRREFPEAKILRAEAAASALAANPLEAARRIHEILYSKGEL
jgi:hypothetical protein